MINLLRHTQHELDRHEISAIDRVQAIELLVCEALASTLPIPTSAVEHPGNYFRMSLRQQAIERLSAINEVQVIDLDDCLELTLQIWKARYRLVHEANGSAARQITHLLVASGTVDIPPQISKFAAAHPTMVCDQWMVDELTKENDDGTR